VEGNKVAVIGKVLQMYLMCSYLYYIRNKSVIPDEQYDKMAKNLLKYWDTFEHQHKYLVTPDDLRAGTLYHLKHDDYPKVVIGGALLLLDKYESEQRKKGM
jgi:NAD-dependent DNA ligase